MCAQPLGFIIAFIIIIVIIIIVVAVVLIIIIIIIGLWSGIFLKNLLVCDLSIRHKLFSIPDMLLPFHIRLERLKLIHYSLITNFSKYHFNTGTLSLLSFSWHILTVSEFDINYFDILFWKIVKPRDHNEIKPPVGKIFRKYKPIIPYFVITPK